jgi:hypothetical protein
MAESENFIFLYPIPAFNPVGLPMIRLYNIRFFHISIDSAQAVIYSRNWLRCRLLIARNALVNHPYRRRTPDLALSPPFRNPEAAIRTKSIRRQNRRFAARAKFGDCNAA